MCAAVASHPPIAKPQDIPRDLKLWRLTVEQYHEMARAGVLTEDDPVELLDGWLVYKMTKNPPHSAATRNVRHAFERLIPTGYFVDSQEPVTLSYSEPEPDVVIIRGDFEDFTQRHPGPQDIMMIVEVANSTLEQDRNSKRVIYAQDKLPIYWIVNLIDQCIEVYTAPRTGARGNDYSTPSIYYADDNIPVQVGEELIGFLKVADLLP